MLDWILGLALLFLFLEILFFYMQLVELKNEFEGPAAVRLSYGELMKHARRTLVLVVVVLVCVIITK